MIRLGIIGCGEITRLRHLPAAVGHPGVKVTALTDSMVARAECQKKHYGLTSYVAQDYKEVFGRVDAVINALPNYLHVPVTLELLDAGIHVLCEKPLATDSKGAIACHRKAIENKLVLAVGMPRRFYESTALMQLVLDERLLGPVEGYDWEYGMPFAWEAASTFYFSRSAAGGGVLLDEGVHLLDCLSQWFGPAYCVKYCDDNWGGVEANAQLFLRHTQSDESISGRLRLSRTYALSNRLMVYGRDARAEIQRSDNAAVILHRNIRGRDLTLRMRLSENRAVADPFFMELDNFVESIHGRSTPAVTAAQAAETLTLIETCYSKAMPIAEPWVGNAPLISKVRA